MKDKTFGIIVISGIVAVTIGSDFLLTWYFPEFLDIAPNCRFRNCTHTHEPGCAIQAAVESGDLTQDRYDRYMRILDTL